MLSVLREISVTCFFTSYLVVLVLELLRLAGRFPGRGLAVIVMTLIGLFTHVTYLLLRTVETPGGNEIGRLATWSDWSLLLALGIVICFLVFYLRRPDTIISFFFLPAVLALIGLSVAVRDMAPFSRTEAFGVWGSVHGLAMMVGAGAVLLGFLVGVMYLVQSYRLKHKRAGSSLRLPTLETLGRINRQCLIVSTSAVAIGVIAGVVMNLNRVGSVSWTEGGVLLSGLLFLWLLAATALEFFYAPASRGRKAVYLTLASLGFLILAMFGVLMSSHGRENEDDVSSNSVPVPSIVVMRLADSPSLRESSCSFNVVDSGEGEAPAEPELRTHSAYTNGSAGASPSRSPESDVLQHHLLQPRNLKAARLRDGRSLPAAAVTAIGEVVS